MIKQRTLKNTVRATGVGIHTGKKVYITLKPATINTGIVFIRTDFKQPVHLKASANLVGDTSMSTTLIKDGVRVATVEHLMAAFSGMGIDNCIVELSTSEVPIMDGSAGPFVFLIQSAGIQVQEQAKKFIKITKTVEVKQADKIARFEPYNGYKLRFDIEFNHPAFSEHTKSKEINLSTNTFIKEISRARTFGFMRDIEMLHENNLAIGGSMDNAIVLDDYRVLNQDGLRYEDEFVKHKILDAIGDIYQLGHPIIGSFYGYKSGHAINNQLARKLLQQTDAWELVTFEKRFQKEEQLYPVFA
ncbi:UDP-3-O-[3-hydroxymyristoyl] N-acetylglucosamine deacetylase [hydrothermal vent metagenome]|uniref:UDP-3-O-acyl-N-acetylglucosamine deacetylase n=1 Tax=hydrothermal vent metagenome TaxID=652676 RepID=A0A3B0VQG7_9ZZZZ